MEEDLPQNPTDDRPDVAEERRGGGGVAALSALLIVVLVLGTGAGVLAWRTIQQDRADAIEAQDALRRGLARQSETLAALQREAASQERLRGLAEVMDQRLADLDRRLSGNEDALGALRQDVGSARADWDLAQAEYLLEMAAEHLAITGDAAATLRALDAADARLATHADPALRAVRARLAEDRLALATLAEVDTQGIALTLAAMARQVSTLPLAQRVPELAAAQPDAAGADPTAPWYARAWQRVRHTLSGLFELKRLDEAPTPLLSGEAVYLLRAQLEASLATARLAALRGDAANYSASLQGSLDLLERHFDTRAPSVAALDGQLRTLAEVDLSPQRPDIRGALIMLRRHLDRSGQGGA